MDPRTLGRHFRSRPCYGNKVKPRHQFTRGSSSTTSLGAVELMARKTAKLGPLITSRVFFVFCCLAIAALSFWSTLMLLRQSGPDPVTALPPGTPQTNLADVPPLRDSGFSWLGIAGLNVQVVAGMPVVSDYPILRLVTLGEGGHTLAARMSGLVKNERYRIMAWIKPQAGANFGIAARDQADKENGPNNGRANFDLASRKVLVAHGNVQSGIELVGDWLTVWIDLLTTDGQYVVNFYLCSGNTESFTGDGKLGVILGGIAAE